MAQEAKIVISAQDNTSAALNAVQTKLKLVKAESAGASEGARKLENAFENLATDAVGLSGGLGMAAESLMAFAGGGLVVGAVAVGIGLLIKYFTDLKNTQVDLKRSSENLAQTVARITGREVEFTLDQKTQELAKAKADLEKAAKSFRAQQGFALMDRGRKGDEGVANAFFLGDVQEKQKAYNDALAAFLDAKKAAEDKGTAEAKAAKDAEERNLREREMNLKRAVETAKKLKADEQRAFDDAAKASASSIKDQISAYNDQTDALVKLVDMGVRTPQLTQALTDAVQQQSLVLANTTPLTKQYADELERLNRLKAAMATAGASSFVNLGGVLIEYDTILKLVDAYKDLNDEKKKGFTLKDAYKKDFMDLQLTAQLASDSFMLFFENLGTGNKYMENVARGFARMVSGIARQKVAFNLAEGVQALASSFGWGALGNFASAAAAKTAAVGHFKAAALWGVIAGGASAAGGAGGGGGGGGSTGGSGRGAVGDDNMSRGSVTVVFPEGLVDLSNPTTQRQFTKLINEVAGNRSINLQGA